LCAEFLEKNYDKVWIFLFLSSFSLFFHQLSFSILFFFSCFISIHFIWFHFIVIFFFLISRSLNIILFFCDRRIMWQEDNLSSFWESYC
jgi:hypothetical protein